MSDMVASVVAGYGHPNTGLPTVAEVAGALYVGGSGRWWFGPAAGPPREAVTCRSFSLASTGNDVLTEIRAGVGVALGLPETAAAHPEWAEFDLSRSALESIAESTRDRGLSLVVTMLDGGFPLEHVQRGLVEPGWSLIVCTPAGEYTESQWDRHTSL